MGSLVRAFWACGDNGIIEYAMDRARLNRNERDALHWLLDECMTQEQAAEAMNISTRQIQNLWSIATGKLLNLPWVLSYSKTLKGQG